MNFCLWKWSFPFCDRLCGCWIRLQECGQNRNPALKMRLSCNERLVHRHVSDIFSQNCSSPRNEVSYESLWPRVPARRILLEASLISKQILTIFLQSQRLGLLIRERSDLAIIIVSRRVVMLFCLSVIFSVRSFLKMYLLRQFLSELDAILTQCSPIWNVCPHE